MVCEEGKGNHRAPDPAYTDKASYQGDEIVETKKISSPASRNYGNRQSDMKSEIELWASGSAHAEEHVSQESSSTFNDTEISTPRLLTIQTVVYKVCTINVDLSPLRDSLHETTNSKGKFYILSFWITMQFHSAQLTFGVEDDDGQPCGATTTVKFI